MKQTYEEWQARMNATRYEVPVITVDGSDTNVVHYPKHWAQDFEHAVLRVEEQLNDQWIIDKSRMEVKSV